MKKILFLILVLALAGQAWASGLDKMVSLSQEIYYNFIGGVDRMQNGDIVVVMDVTFPPKYFQKAAIVELTPIMRYEGGEKEFESKVIQGELVQASNEICSFANGGTFRLKFKMPFEDRIRGSEMFIRVKVSVGKKERICPNVNITCDYFIPYVTQCGNSRVIIDFDNSKAFSWLIVYDVNGKKGDCFETKLYPDDPRKKQILENNNVKDVFYSGIKGINGIKGNVFPADNSYTFDGLIALNPETGNFEEQDGIRKYKDGLYREIEISGYRIKYTSPYGNEISQVIVSLNKSPQWKFIGNYIKDAKELQITYSNKDTFKGNVTFVNGKITPDYGVYTYANGDKFTGSVTKKAAGGIYVDGTTTFKADYKSVSGNWLSIYELTASQLAVLEKIKYPTEKMKYAEEIKAKEMYYKFMENGDKAFQAKKYDDAEYLYTLALNSLTEGMDSEENIIKDKLNRIKESMYETIRTESIKKGNDKYVVEHTRMGYRLKGYDDKGRIKFEYENNSRGTINLSTWNMKIPNRGKLVRYNYDFRGVLSSRNYYNENQSYFFKEVQNSNGEFICLGIYENSGEFMEDILIEASIEIGLFSDFYIMYRNDPKTGMKSKITSVSKSKAREWLLDYLYKLD